MNMLLLIYIIGCLLSYTKYIGNKYSYFEQKLKSTKNEVDVPTIKDMMLYDSALFYVLISWFGFIILTFYHFKYKCKYFFKLNLNSLNIK